MLLKNVQKYKSFAVLVATIVVAGSWLSETHARSKNNLPIRINGIDLRLEPNAIVHDTDGQWHKQVVYMAMIDRFDRAGAGDNAPSKTNAVSRDWQGGNLNGLTARLDYLKGMGVTTLWINPVVVNTDDGYHGYAAVNFLDVDPRFGTLADLKTLVRTAHAKGMRVVLDVVMNHAGRVFEYEGDDQWSGRQSKRIKQWANATPLQPPELAHAENFTRGGSITNWEDPEQSVHGDFFGLRDFNLSDRRVQNLMIQQALWWIKETDIDGFRLDTVKHAPADFWPRFNRSVRRYTHKMGKSNFLLLGENYNGDPHALAADIRRDRNRVDPKTARPDTFDSVFDFKSLLAATAAQRGYAPTGQIAWARQAVKDALGDQADERMMARMLDNHDVSRFLRHGMSIKKLYPALASLLLGSGIPVIYYGTEQGMAQPENAPDDPGNRVPMFGRFDTKSKPYQWTKQLTDLRRDYPALAGGEHYDRYADPDNVGLYAFSRIENGQEVLVVINYADHPKSMTNLWVDTNLSQPGTKLIDALHPKYSTVTYAHDGGSQLNIEVPAHGVRVLVHHKAFVKPHTSRPVAALTAAMRWRPKLRPHHAPPPTAIRQPNNLRVRTSNPMAQQ